MSMKTDQENVYVLQTYKKYTDSWFQDKNLLDDIIYNGTYTKDDVKEATKQGSLETRNQCTFCTFVMRIYFVYIKIKYSTIVIYRYRRCGQ